MGFFDTVGNIAKDMAESAKKQADEIQKIKQKFEGYSDHKLIDIYKDDSMVFGSTSMEKRIAKKLLEDRGHII